VLAGQDALMAFEDDLELHPNFRHIVERLVLPEDWGILYFGCTHVWEPIPVSPGIVKCTRVYATHAYAVRRPYFKLVAQEMRGKNPITTRSKDCDVAMTNLSHIIPTYSVYPNIAWQRLSLSNIGNAYRQPFKSNGDQAVFQNSVRRVASFMEDLNSEAGWAEFQRNKLHTWRRCPECNELELPDPTGTLPCPGCELRKRRLRRENQFMSIPN
jgi:hypothetical protein